MYEDRSGSLDKSMSPGVGVGPNVHAHQWELGHMGIELSAQEWNLGVTNEHRSGT
jgi:hypothetical protein